MPPAPRLKVTLVPARYSALCQSLGLTEEPPVRFVTNGKPGKFLGMYWPATNSIDIFCNFASIESGRLIHAQGELIDTLLHELKHAHQKQLHGSEWYRKNVVKAENEANEYAASNRHLWRGVVQLKRVQHGSAFSKLSRHASRQMV